MAGTLEGDGHMGVRCAQANRKLLQVVARNRPGIGRYGYPVVNEVGLARPVAFVGCQLGQRPRGRQDGI